MALPSTGGSWETVLEPNLNPLGVRYWQITDVLIQDYRNANGVPNNWSDSSVGLGSAGLFTPFAADGTVRQDLLINTTPPNQGFYYGGELKEDITAITSDITVQETPTAQSVRTVRDVITKLDDKVNFTFIESGPLQDYLRYELPLANGIPDLGEAGYQVARGPMDQLQERTIVLLGVDTDGFLRAEVFPRVVTNKKGKTDFNRKNPESYEYTGTALPDPFTGKVMWVCREGSNWRAEGGVPVFPGSAPVAAATSTGKATVTFTNVTGSDLPPTFTAQVSQDGGTTWTTAALDTTTAPPNGWTIGASNTVVSLKTLTSGASTFKVTATGTNGATATSQTSNSATIT